MRRDRAAINQERSSRCAAREGAAAVLPLRVSQALLPGRADRTALARITGHLALEARDVAENGRGVLEASALVARYAIVIGATSRRLAIANATPAYAHPAVAAVSVRLAAVAA